MGLDFMVLKIVKVYIVFFFKSGKMLFLIFNDFKI